LKEENATKQRAIEELERRRDMAKKEIKQLYGRLQKKPQEETDSSLLKLT
jgi:hypothetical protein